MVTPVASAWGVNMRHTILNVQVGQKASETNVNIPSLIFYKSSKSFTKLCMCSNWQRMSSIQPIALYFLLLLVLLSPLMNVPTCSAKNILIASGVSMEQLTIAAYFQAYFGDYSFSDLCFSLTASSYFFVMSIKNTAVLGTPLYSYCSTLMERKMQSTASYSKSSAGEIFFAEQLRFIECSSLAESPGSSYYNPYQYLMI